MSRSKPIIGISGGIGAGKSAVAQAFGELGALVISSDDLNREVLASEEVAQTLRGWWGDRVIGEDGRVDRRALARIVFEDAKKKRRLESLVHPLIARRRADIIRTSAGDPKVKAIILDSPLLFESSLDRECDAVVFVEASETRRAERLRKQRGWNIRDIRLREQWQRPLAEKRSRCQYVIRNEGTRAELRTQVKNVFERIIAEHASDR